METAGDQYQKMTQMPVEKLIPRLAAPTMMSMMSAVLYNTADTWFVSQLGDSATAATGVCLPLTAMIQAVGFWIGMGAGSNISRFLGRKHNFKASIVATSAVLLTIFISICLGLFGFFGNELILKHLGSTPTILPYAREYSRIIFLGTPFACTGFVFNNLLRSQGRAVFAMAGVMSGAIINIILDPVFIFVFDMGIAGAALSTVICQVISFLVMLTALCKESSMLKISTKFVSKNPGIYFLIMSTGMPSLFRQGCSALATILLNRAGAQYGDAAVAAMSIVGRVSFLITSLVGGFGQGYQPVVGFAFGAGDFSRVKKAYQFSLSVCLTILFLGGLYCIFQAETIMRFFRADSPRVIEIGTETFLFYGISMPFNCVIILTNMLLQVTGQKVLASITSIMRQGVVFIPLILILPEFIGMKGVEICQPLSDAVSAAVAASVAVYFFKRLSCKNFQPKNLRH